MLEADPGWIPIGSSEHHQGAFLNHTKHTLSPKKRRNHSTNETSNFTEEDKPSVNSESVPEVTLNPQGIHQCEGPTEQEQPKEQAVSLVLLGDTGKYIHTEQADTHTKVDGHKHTMGQTHNGTYRHPSHTQKIMNIPHWMNKNKHIPG